MKKILLLLAYLLVYSTGIVVSQDYQRIKSVIANVSADSLMENLRILSGDKIVKIDGSDTRITSRYRNSTGNAAAASFIKSKLSNYKSLQVIEQPLPDSGRNIIATQTGVENPKRKIIICSHFDSFLPGNDSPGADDNGTGTAAVMEAARVLSDYTSSNTIIYAFFDREEEDLVGSEYFASQAAQNKDSIIAVINLDMLGWDKNGYYDIEVVKKEVSTSAQLASSVSTLNDQCQIGTYITVTTNKGIRDADNVSFWNYNFPAILIIELYGMQNPFMHKATDLVKNINKNFFLKCSQLGIGMVARYTNLTAIDGTTSVNKEIPMHFTLEQNYPNPFNPITVISWQLPVSSNVTLKVYDILGREVATLVDRYIAPGKYQVQFSTNGYQLSSGTYFYRLVSANFIATRKLMVLR